MKMSNKPISFTDLRDGLSESERLEHLLSNRLYYCSLADFVEDLRTIYVRLASSDTKTLLEDKKKVYFDFAEYGGAVLCNAVVAMCAHLNKTEAIAEGGVKETYRRTINSVDPFNLMGSFLAFSGGRPKFVLNMVFSIGNKNVARGFFRDPEEENVVAEEEGVDGPEKLLRHHIVLHGEGIEINPYAASVLEGGLDRHSKRVVVKNIEVEGYPSAPSSASGTVNMADDCTVTVDRIGIHCADRMVFDEMIYLIENDPLSVLLHLVLEGSV